MNNDFVKSDFDKLRLPVHLMDMKSCDVYHSFPELKYYPEFSHSAVSKLPGLIKFTEILSYIVYVYDINSPYIKKYDNLLRRKRMVALDVGFKQKATGKFGQDVTDIILCYNDFVNAMIVRYLRMQNNVKWMSMVSYMQAKTNADIGLISSNTDAGDLAKLQKVSGGFEKDISRLQEELLMAENAPKIIDLLYDEIEDEELMTPELVAMKAFKREKPRMFSPWKNPMAVEEYLDKKSRGESTKQWDNPHLRK